MSLTRRAFLSAAGAGALLGLLPARAAAQVNWLQNVVDEQVGSRNIGIDVARFVRDGAQVREVYRVGTNQNALRPSASCLKAWVLLYYYTFTPPDAWDDAPGTDPYNVIVNSHNVATGRLIRDVGRYQAFGNDIEKFNDFLIYGMRMEHGISAWNWDSNPVEGIIDGRFAAGGTRVVQAKGTTHEIGNVTTAADTLNGYRELYRRSFALDADPYGGDVVLRRQAALRAMRLLSLPSDAAYEAPLERVLGRGVYIGKDGVLPSDSTTVGRVINDAGMIPMENGVVGLSFFSVAESEFSAVEILRAITRAVYAVEPTLTL